MSSKQSSSPIDQELGIAEDQYVIEKIVDKKIVRNKTLYLCKWNNWDDQDNTWEPIENLSRCPELIEEFEASLKKGKNSKKAEEPINKVKKMQSKTHSNEQKQKQSDLKKPSKLKKPNEKIKQMIPQNEKRANENKDKTIPKNRAQNLKIQTPPKYSSNSAGNNNFYNVQDGDIIQRINYHQYVNDKLYYCVDSHTKEGKVLPCYLKTSQQLKKCAPLMLIKYIEDFVIEVEQYNNDRRMAQKNVDTNTQ